MRITRDNVADAAYVGFVPIREGVVVDHVVLTRPGGELVLDFDRDGRVLGLEIIGTAALAPHGLLAEAQPLRAPGAGVAGLAPHHADPSRPAPTTPSRHPYNSGLSIESCQDADTPAASTPAAAGRVTRRYDLAWRRSSPQRSRGGR